MPLTPGTCLGTYNIVAPLGAGGMGEVWKGLDTRLNRTVAIKTASAVFSDRFDREARAIAALNHPNICQLYDIGPNYLVMEFVEGAPIAPVDTSRKLLDLAVQIADGLSAAHAAGLIHRDLKPDNIMVTRDGRVKILDFGLAKTTAVTPSVDATRTIALTDPGTTIGTVNYMSPEQARGNADLSAQSDQFSFGLVLYEIAAGKRPFQRGSAAETMTAIIREDAEPLPASTPAPLRWIVERLLSKEPADRYDSTRDLYRELRQIRERLSETTTSGTAQVRALPQRGPKRALLGLTVVALLALLLAAGAWWFALRKAPAAIWAGRALGGPSAMGPRVSPDGHTVAFLAMLDGQTQAAIMKPESGSWTVLTHQTDLGESGVIDWSRDGSRLYFDRSSGDARRVFSVPVLGGEPRLVLENAGAPCVLADGSLGVVRINVQRDFQLFHYWPDSGKIEPLAGIVASNFVDFVLRATPDGKGIVFYGHSLDSKGRKGDLGIYVLDIASGKPVNVAPGQGPGFVPALAATPDGKNVLYTRYEEGLISVISTPISRSGEARTMFTLTNRTDYLDVGPDGVYADQIQAGQLILRFPARGGVTEHLTQLQGDRVGLVLVLPDGRPLVYSDAGFRRRLQIVQPDGSRSQLVESNENFHPPGALVGDHRVAVLTSSKSPEIAIISIDDGRITDRVPVKAEGIRSLASSPDGKMFYYSSGGDIWSLPAAGGNPQKLMAGDSVSADPNGRDLLVARLDNDGTQLFRLPVTGGEAQRVVFHGDVHLSNALLGVSAIGPGGLIAVGSASADKWLFQTALIDPRAGTIVRIPMDFDGETHTPVWTRDGRIVVDGTTYGFSIWRFHPVR